VGRNRFPVLTFFDNQSISNKDSFYIWLDNWGASDFYAVSDVVSTYKIAHNLQFNVWAAHYQPHQVIYIDSSATIQLNQSDKARFVTSFEWNTLNTDESQGRSVASGVYLYRMKSGETAKSKKMVLVK
jgi:hypothetical protein